VLSLHYVQSSLDLISEMPATYNHELVEVKLLTASQLSSVLNMNYSCILSDFLLSDKFRLKHFCINFDI